MGIYVETTIKAPIEDLWRTTQVPTLHERWDLRFTAIRIGFGLAIRGEGETTGVKDSPDGRRTSALRFWSDDPKSLIVEGAGYWQYLPEGAGVRFLTRYDYRTRFGPAGRAIDAVAFRPLIAWATAWSFDRLRRWLEDGLDPALAARLAAVHAIARLAVAAIWIYHGLVPKLLAPSPTEIDLLVAAGLSAATARAALPFLGMAEVGFGLVVLAAWTARWPLLATIALLAAATVGVTATASAILLGAFNPLTLNLATIGLAAIGAIVVDRVPSARRVRWTSWERHR
jgi:hypothetical protein